MPMKRLPDPDSTFPYGPEHGLDENDPEGYGWYESWTPEAFPGTQPAKIEGQLELSPEQDTEDSPYFPEDD